MKTANRFTPWSGYPRQLLGGNLVIESAEQGRALLMAVRNILGGSGGLGVYSTQGTPLASRGIDYVIMTDTGIVVSIDATDCFGKNESRTAQVFVSQSDADAGYGLAARNIAGIITASRNYLPVSPVVQHSSLRLFA